MIRIAILIDKKLTRIRIFKETDQLEKLKIEVYKICDSAGFSMPVQYWNQTKNRRFKDEDSEKTLQKLNIKTGDTLLVSTDYPEDEVYNLALKHLELEDEEDTNHKLKEALKRQSFQFVYPELASEEDQKPKCKLKLKNKINSNSSDSKMGYREEFNLLLQKYLCNEPIIIILEYGGLELAYSLNETREEFNLLLQKYLCNELIIIILEYGGFELAYSLNETYESKNYFYKKATLDDQVKEVIMYEWEKLTEKMQINIMRDIDEIVFNKYFQLSTLRKFETLGKEERFLELEAAFIEKNYAKFKLAYYYNNYYDNEDKLYKKFLHKKFSDLWKKSYKDEICIDFIEQLLIFDPSYAGCILVDDSKFSYTLLQHACKMGAYNHVELLLTYNAALVEQEITRDNPLSLAVQASNIEIVEILLMHGAKVTDGIITVAVTLENRAIIKLLELNYKYPEFGIKSPSFKREIPRIPRIIPSEYTPSEYTRENTLDQIDSDIPGEADFIKAAIQFKGAKFTEAYRYFKLSAENQYPPAYLYLGLMNKFGMQSNNTLAEKYFGKAEEMSPWFEIQADTRDAIAVQNMGLYYQYVEKNSRKARVYFDNADKLDHTKYPILLIALKEVCYWDKSVFSFTEKELMLYQYLASYDNAMAQYAMGMCYQYGIAGFSKNEKNADNYFKKSAEQGYLPAQFRLGIKCLFNKDMSKDRYIQTLTTASASCYLPMTGLVGVDILFQHFVMHYGKFSASEAQDIKFAKTAVEKEFRKGIICYSAGRYQQAINYFESSSAYPPSLLYLLAIYTLEYSGIDKASKMKDSFEKVQFQISFFETLKAKDDTLKTAEIQCYLGIYLLFREDNEQIRKEMMSAFNKAAEAGYTLAEYLLGKFYYEGLKVEKNYDLARNFLLQAAKKDNAPAQFFFSSHIDENKIFLKNYWMRSAATLGHEMAIFAIDPELPKLKVSQMPSHPQKTINFSSLIPPLLEWWQNETIIKKFVKNEEHKELNGSKELKKNALRYDYDWVEAKENSYSFFESVTEQLKYFKKTEEKSISSQELCGSVLNELETKKEFYLNKIELSWIKFFNLADLIAINIIAYEKNTIIVIFCENTHLIVRPEGAKEVMVFANLMGSFMQPLFPRSDLRLDPGKATPALDSVINTQQQKNGKRKVEKNRKTKNKQHNRKKNKVRFFPDGGVNNSPLMQTSTSQNSLG